jgi:hypothetical protein
MGERDEGATRRRIFEYLVIALLSVNSYPLERTWRLREDLGRAGLCDPTHVASLNEEELASRLERAGYDRGDFLGGLVASRLNAVANYLIDIGWRRAATGLREGSHAEVTDLLIQAKGVGPAVIRNFLLLRDSRDASAER